MKIANTDLEHCTGWTFVIRGALILIVIIACLGACRDNGSRDTIDDNGQKGDSIDFKTEIKNNIKSLSGDDFNFDDFNDPASFVTFVALYKAYGRTIFEGKKSSDDSIKYLIVKLEQKVIKSQKKNFPKARLAYQKMLRNKLWEDDIDVTISGARNTTLNFVGAIYVANRNIKETQDAIHEMITHLRFKQTTYRWFKDSDEYQYYTIESPKDEIVND